ncbi:MAG TPA: secretin N-terminal domain-containing protein, partial [Rhodoferax sp.]
MNTEELTMTEYLLNIRRDPLYLDTGKHLARAGLVAAALALGGCAADRPLRTPSVSDAIRAAVSMPAAAVTAASVPVPARIADALVEPATPPVALPPEPRIDLLVNNAPAREVFLAMVADTRYSMLMHPDVAGTLSVTLRGVTITEALEAIRDVYGYDFKMDGRRITIFAPTLQTRIFTINYPNSQRSGNSDLRVSSGSEGRSSGTSGSGSTSGGGSTTGSIQAESSR